MAVSFRNRQLKLDTAESTAAIVEQLKPGITRLDLGGNTFGLAACEHVAKTLSSVPTLKELLFDDMFTSRKESEIHPALKLFTSYIPVQHLVYLDLSDNALNHHGAENIKPLLAKALSLETLKLNNTGVSYTGGQFIGEGLMEAYHNGRNSGRSYQLKHFILGRSRLHNEGIVPLSAAFKKIGTLEEIRVFYNAITGAGIVALAHAVQRNPNLRILDISDNAAKRQGAAALGEALKHCPRLEVLLMESCHLRDAGMDALLAGLAGKGQLREVDFCYNELTPSMARKLAAALQPLPSLTSVRLNGNEFGDSGLEALQVFGDKLGTTSDNEESGEEQDDHVEDEPVHEEVSDTDESVEKEVSFRDKQKQVDTVTDVQPFIEALAANLDAGTLDFGGNTFSLPACEAIATVLAKMKALRVLKFDDMFTRRKNPEIHPALRAFSTALLSQSLVYLDLSDNALNPTGAEAIAPLISNCLSLKTLRLNNTGVGPTGGVTIGKALFAAYTKGVAENRPYQLHHFILGRSRLEDPGIIQIARALQRIGTLVEIRVNNNGFHEEGAIALGEALAANPRLEILEVSDNVIKPRGAAVFGRSLTSCPALKLLTMEDCRLRTAGARHILAALPSLKVLSALDLCYNEMTGEIARSLAKILPGLPDLTEVRVNGNEFGQSAIDELTEASSNVGTFSDDEGSGDEQHDEVLSEVPAQASGLASDAAGPASAAAAAKSDSALDSLVAAVEHVSAVDRGSVITRIIAAPNKDSAAAELLAELDNGVEWVNIFLELVGHGGLGAAQSAVAVLVAGVQSEAHMAPFISTLLAKLQLIRNETVARMPLPFLVRTWGTLHNASSDVRALQLWRSISKLGSDTSIAARSTQDFLAPYVADANVELNAARRNVLASIAKHL